MHLFPHPYFEKQIRIGWQKTDGSGGDMPPIAVICVQLRV